MNAELYDEIGRVDWGPMIAVAMLHKTRRFLRWFVVDAQTQFEAGPFESLRDARVAIRAGCDWHFSRGTAGG